MQQSINCRLRERNQQIVATVRQCGGSYAGLCSSPLPRYISSARGFRVHNNSSFGAANRTGTRGNVMRLPSRTLSLFALVALVLPPGGCRAGRGLSDQAGQVGRRLSAGRHHRHPGAHHRPVAVGAARPAVRHREQAGRRQQYRDRGGGERRRPTATRSCSSIRPTPSTPRSTRSCRSISCATSRRSPASCACRT